jgi:predicted nucleotidyltransferase
MLLLFGSRARGNAETRSDWDFAYVAAPGFDVVGLLAGLVEIVGSDRVDLADLERATGLLRYRAARDGQLLFEARPGIWDQFRFETTLFWCDALPILQRGYEEVLAELNA